MDLSKLSMKKIRELIIFTVLLVVALWKFEVVIDMLKTMLANMACSLKTRFAICGIILSYPLQ